MEPPGPGSYQDFDFGSERTKNGLEWPSPNDSHDGDDDDKDDANDALKDDSAIMACGPWAYPVVHGSPRCNLVLPRYIQGAVRPGAPMVYSIAQSFLLGF